MAKKVLIVEDEDAIRDFVSINLKRAGYEAVDADCGEAALEQFKADSFAVVLLDIMMPGIDGFTVCRKIREQDPKVAIIMLSAKSQEMDKINGLMLGADDYITKPFSPSELIARVDANYRRYTLTENQPQPQQQLVSGPFILNKKSRSITKNGEPIELTQVEFQIVEQFLQNKNIALGRTEILDYVWGTDYFGDEKIVDVNIRRLRMKLEDDPSDPAYILTVWGYGYKWNETRAE